MQQQSPPVSPLLGFALELTRNFGQALEQLPAIHSSLAAKDGRIAELEARIAELEAPDASVSLIDLERRTRGK